MAKVSIEQRIAQLEAQKKALKARLTKQERAKDTRRKVLLGALVLHRLDDVKNPADAARMAEWLKRELPGFLTRAIDRELFPDLVPKTAENDADGSGAETDEGHKEEKEKDGAGDSQTPHDDDAGEDHNTGADRTTRSGRF